MVSRNVSRVEAMPHLGTLAPVRVTAIADITALQGNQIIDGYTTVNGDRVLLTAQADGTQNGVWIASSSDWVRSPDWNASGDIVSGVIITDQNTSTVYQVSFTGDFTIDVTTPEFTEFGAGVPVAIDDDGSPVTTAATKINFIGATVTEPVPNEVTVTINASGAPVYAIKNLTYVELGADATLFIVGYHYSDYWGRHFIYGAEGTTDVVYYSDDTITWTAATVGDLGTGISFTAIAENPNSGVMIGLVTNTSTTGSNGLTRSTDGGVTWTSLGRDTSITSSPAVLVWNKASNSFALFGQEYSRSCDDGKTWIQIALSTGVKGGNRALVSPTQMLVSTGNGNVGQIGDDSLTVTTFTSMGIQSRYGAIYQNGHYVITRSAGDLEYSTSGDNAIGKPNWTVVSYGSAGQPFTVFYNKIDAKWYVVDGTAPYGWRSSPDLDTWSDAAGGTFADFIAATPVLGRHWFSEDNERWGVATNGTVKVRYIT